MNSDVRRDRILDLCKEIEVMATDDLELHRADIRAAATTLLDLANQNEEPEK